MTGYELQLILGAGVGVFMGLTIIAGVWIARAAGMDTRPDLPVITRRVTITAAISSVLIILPLPSQEAHPGAMLFMILVVWVVGWTLPTRRRR